MTAREELDYRRTKHRWKIPVAAGTIVLIVGNDRLSMVTRFRQILEGTGCIQPSHFPVGAAGSCYIQSRLTIEEAKRRTSCRSGESLNERVSRWKRNTVSDSDMRRRTIVDKLQKLGCEGTIRDGLEIYPLIQERAKQAADADPDKVLSEYIKLAEQHSFEFGTPLIDLDAIMYGPLTILTFGIKAPDNAECHSQSYQSQFSTLHSYHPVPKQAWDITNHSWKCQPGAERRMNGDIKGHYLSTLQ